MPNLKPFDNTEQIIRSRLVKKACNPEIVTKLEAAISRGLYELMEIPSLEVPENWRGEFEPWRIEIVTRSWEYEEQALLCVNVDLEADNADLTKIANKMDLQYLYYNCKETWFEGKDMMLIKFLVSAPQSEEDIVTLRNLGKIRTEHSHYSNSYETIYCEV